MHLLNTLFVTSLFAALSVAQGPPTNFSASQIQTIINEENAMNIDTLGSWCTAQFSNCGNLCGGPTDKNSCNSTDLSFTCVCTSNHSAPALQYYLNTIPTYLCQTSLGDCLSNNTGNKAGQDACPTLWPCGTIDATNLSITPATTSSSSSSATPAPSNTGSTTSTSASTTPSASHSAAMAVKIGQDYGFGILFAGLLGVFGMAL